MVLEQSNLIHPHEGLIVTMCIPRPRMTTDQAQPLRAPQEAVPACLADGQNTAHDVRRKSAISIYDKACNARTGLNCRKGRMGSERSVLHPICRGEEGRIPAEWRRDRDGETRGGIDYRDLRKSRDPDGAAGR